MIKQILLILFCYFPLYAQYPPGEEILAKIDRNYYSDTRVSVSKMKINGRRRSRTVKSRSWIEGDQKSFTEYLAPAREKGTKMLKIGDKLWTYSPSTDRIIQIAGHMLRQSVMGSDLSYEDFMEDQKLTNIYNATVITEEMFKDRKCWVLELIAIKSDVAYFSRKIWVDQERMLPLKEERFAKSGKMLKTFEITQVFKIDNRWYPKEMILKDVLKKGKGTEVFIESIEFDVKIPKYIFTKAALKK